MLADRRQRERREQWRPLGGGRRRQRGGRARVEVDRVAARLSADRAPKRVEEPAVAAGRGGGDGGAVYLRVGELRVAEELDVALVEVVEEVVDERRPRTILSEDDINDASMIGLRAHSFTLICLNENVNARTR